MFLGPLLSPALLTGLLLTLSEPDWRPLDDPDADRVPTALRELAFAERAIYQSATQRSYLIERRITGQPSAYDAFMADEEAMANFGELIPIADRLFDEDGSEVVEFECEWNRESGAALILANYRMLDDGDLRVLWLITGEESSFDALRTDLAAALDPASGVFDRSEATRYDGVLIGHRLSFNLDMPARGDDPSGAGIRLRPVDVAAPEDTVFQDAVSEANPQFESGIVRQWADEERGVSLSLQVFATDSSIGPKEPLARWLGGQFQVHMRADSEDGDIPIEIVHLPDAKTRVVDAQELQRHYIANRRAPEGGVILGVYLPRTPFAVACKLRWPDTLAKRIAVADAKAAADEDEPSEAPAPPSAPEAPASTEPETPEEPDKFGLVHFIELREYRRSRSETITRSFVVMLLARAETEADLELFESELRLVTEPLDSALRFPFGR